MASDDDTRILEALQAARQAGWSAVLAVVVRTQGSVPRHAGSKMLVYEDGNILGTIGGGEMEARVKAAAARALESGKPEFITYNLVDPVRGDPGVCGGTMEVYVEPFLPPATVLVVGCGHVGQKVAELAHWLGYRVAVSDDRVELATPENVPRADVYLPGPLQEGLEKFAVTRNTFVVLVTRNVLVDRESLPVLARTPAPYIGVMGSRRRWTETRRLLAEEGLDEAQLARFHSPIGLELGAETPEEIAVSILAEITRARRTQAARHEGGARASE